ncbi:MAG: 30S ribosomal protein S9 [Bacteroidota bacterium]
MSVQYFEGIGRRKESTARVRVMSGSGKFSVNEKEARDFFTRMGDMEDILRPFAAIGQDAAQYDITVIVNGGGVTGQTEAVRLGLARALLLINGEWTSALRKFGLLTRDARVKERKKPGLKRARKAPTYTKR